MTENEAIEILKNNFPKTCKKLDGRYKDSFDDTEGDFGKALLLSISALKEIQKYHAIGTVERFQQLAEQFKPHVTDKTSCPERHCNKCDKYRKENEMYHEIGTVEQLADMKEDFVEALSDWRQYRKIGTVEECRAARERQTSRKPDIYGDGIGDDGETIYDTWICPNCEQEYEIDYDHYKYCPECGQAIDRSDI